jgi:hypothetical protein
VITIVADSIGSMDPDPKLARQKMAHKKVKKFHVLNAFEGLEASFIACKTYMGGRGGGAKNEHIAIFDQKNLPFLHLEK